MALVFKANDDGTITTNLLTLGLAATVLFLLARA